MADLFQRIEDRKDEWNVEVLVTFLEIYNEEIRDLLAESGSFAPRGGLSIREDKTVKVVGLVELKPSSAEEVKEIVLQGNLRRTQSPTHANETSSRSHAVLQVHITQSPRTASLTEERTMATLSIIDLAGSERAAATTNMGQRMVEGANINKSLLALGNCINALCESGGAIRHVPYRNSKLTRLLKFSLGGNCKTVMIVCVAPTSNHFDDTHNTLVYAERATKIKTKVVTRNVVNVDRHVGQYVEAINRLNLEIAELKAKLASKNRAESDTMRRKKAEANAEVERAKADMQAKVEQTKATILDGATCMGKASVAQTKLRGIRARLAEIDLDSPLSPDQQVEHDLLTALATPEEQVMKPDSSLSRRLQKAANSRAMFDATMRAVSERKSERLDEASMNTVRLNAQCWKVEMEALKMEAERNAMKEAVEDIAQVVVGLVGMLGKCTLVVGDAARALTEPSDTGDDKAKQIAAVLGSIKQKNDEAFMTLLGHSTSQYDVASRPSSALGTFKGYEPSFTRRVSSNPLMSETAASTKRSSRSSETVPGSPRRTFRSPRKSLRSNLASQPYRRASDKEKRAIKASKNVQWRDEAGQGALDDGSPKAGATVVNVIPPSPAMESSSHASSSSSHSAPQRSMSMGGSESDWEDDNEKTDDSVSLLSFSASLPPSTHDRSYGSLGTKRSRPSRLDPSFLKSKKGMTLDSLAEDDESASDSSQRYASQPLSDRLNRLDESIGGLRKTSGERRYSRSLATPRAGAASSKSRRRSGVGLRAEKGRRRSSLIPQLSPPINDLNKPRRVLLSPGKKGKRLSLPRGSSKIRMPSLGNLSVMDTSVNDLSFNKSRPTWR